MSGGDSGGGGSTTTVQRADPWEDQRPYLTYGFGQASDQYQHQVPQYYPGAITAPVDPLTHQARAALVGNVAPMQGLANQAAATAQFNMGEGRDPAANPYLQSAIQAAIDPMIRDFKDSGGALQTIREGAMDAGQFGGTRQGIAEGLAADRLQRNMLGATAQMANQGYQSAQDNATKTLALSPTIGQALTAPAAALDAVGSQRRADTQQQINDNVQQWNFAQNLPSAMLSQYMNLIQGNWGGTNSATSTGTGGTSSSPLSGALGGAMSGWQLGSMIPGGGPVGAGIGALLSFL